MTQMAAEKYDHRWLPGLCLLLGCFVSRADPAKELDLSLDLDINQQYIEEIIVTAEPWREPRPRPEDDEWRAKTPTIETGPVTWGYDSAYDEMRAQRERDLYMTFPDLRDPQPTSTVFQVKF
jgi:hypothetical protein